MSARVLFVDDEPNVLDGIRRQLRNRLHVETANGAAAGLEMVESKGPYAVVVSDMRMPEMNGAKFLARVNEIAPDTVRMVLSGQSDIDSTVKRVAGNVNQSPDQMAAYLKSRGSSIRSIRRQIEGEMAWRRLQSKKIESTVNVGDEEVNAVIDKMNASKSFISAASL